MDIRKASFPTRPDVPLENHSCEHSLSKEGDDDLVEKVGLHFPKKPRVGPMESPDIDMPLLILPSNCHADLDEFDLEGKTESVKLIEITGFSACSKSAEAALNFKNTSQRIPSSKIPRFSIRKHLITSCNSKVN